MPVSNAPWDGSASRYDSTEAYCTACLIDENDPGAPKVQGKCHLPIKEPGGAINRNAVHAAAGGHGVGQVQASAESKRTAARRLVTIYRRDLKEEPPESITRMVGTAS